MTSNHNGKALQAARQALQAGDRVRAGQLLRQAARQDPTDHRPWLWLAGIAASPQASLVYIERAEALRPGDPAVDKARRWAEERLEQSNGSIQASAAKSVFPHGDILGILAISVLLLALVALAPTFWPLEALRLLLGLTCVLFVPGYALQVAVFPRNKDLDGIERAALSIALSVAVIPLLAFVLDKLPWGIRLWPVAIGETLVMAGASLAAIIRRRSLPTQERYALVLEVNARNWWREQDRLSRLIYASMAAGLIIALLSAASMILFPGPGNYFTEFYMLGAEGLAENFPREAVTGETLSVTAGLANKERHTMTYRVEIWAVDPWDDRREKVGESIPITLQPGESIEWPLSWSMPWPGDDQKVEFLLFNDQSDQSYRQLRLWLNVTDQ